ncbi:hypothetical protein [Stackebrandtia albiflava]|uniref:hypothetical protein n=1 Tax=Stackebrandtia albiflava TaxID=406432 RepID=UPI0011BE25D6|nr:hypothetical protein [Stackebrandtia albiflava]
MKRILATAAVTAAIGATVAAPSAATPATEVSVSPQTVEAGHNITVSGGCGNGATTADIWYGTPGGGPLVVLNDVAGTAERITGTLLVTGDTPPGVYLAAVQCAGGAPETTHFNVASGGTKAGDGSLAEGSDTILFIGGGMLLAAAIAATFYYRRNDSAGTA